MRRGIKHIRKYTLPVECCYNCGRYTVYYKRVKDYMLGHVTICDECAGHYDVNVPGHTRRQAL